MRKDLEGTDKNLYLCIRFRPEKSINDERKGAREEGWRRGGMKALVL